MKVGCQVWFDVAVEIAPIRNVAFSASGDLDFSSETIRQAFLRVSPIRK